MSSSMRNFMEAYSAVYNTEAKEALTSGRDEITEMNLSSLTESDLDEVVESVLEEMFQKGYSVDSAHAIFSEMFVESNIKGRQEKIDRLCESLNKAFEVIDSKASTVAMEEFVTYRNNKRLQESWSARFNQEKRIERTHNHLIAQESLNVKTLLLKLVEKADKSYLETDMKKRQANNEKARKDMEKMGTSMKNPHFEEVSQIRKGWGDAYASIYEKKLDPVGKEDGDVDNDGDEDSSDEYLMKRRKAIGKAMGKKNDDVKEDVEQIDEISTNTLKSYKKKVRQGVGDPDSPKRADGGSVGDRRERKKDPEGTKHSPNHRRDKGYSDATRRIKARQGYDTPAPSGYKAKSFKFEEVEQVDEVMKHQKERDRIEKMKKSPYYSAPTKGVHGEIERRKNQKAPAKLRSGSLPEEVENVGEGIDFKGAKRIDDARKAAREKLYKKSPSTKQKDLMKGKFRPGASDEERKSGYRDIMREKGTQPKKDGKPMFTNEEIDRIEAIVNSWED